MLRHCAGRATAVRSPFRRALPSPVLSGVPLPTPPKSAEDFACNTQHGRQRLFSATLQCFSCARAQLPASLADNGCPTFPAARPTITPCCSAPTAARLAVSPFKTDSSGNTAPQPRGVQPRAILRAQRPQHAGTLPQKTLPRCGGALRRSKNALLSAISEKFLRRTRPGRRLLSRRAVGNPDLTSLSGAVRLFSSNPTELLGIVLFRSRRRAHASLPPCRMAQFRAAVRPVRSSGQRHAPVLSRPCHGEAAEHRGAVQRNQPPGHLRTHPAPGKAVLIERSAASGDTAS